MRKLKFPKSLFKDKYVKPSHKGKFLCPICNKLVPSKYGKEYHVNRCIKSLPFKRRIIFKLKKLLSYGC
jgi:hypothetical protein